MPHEGCGAASEMLRRIEAVLLRRGWDYTRSSLGDARYWAPAGVHVHNSDARIRTATYYHRHDMVVDIVITPERAREISLTEAEVTQAADDAIALCMCMADDTDESEKSVP